jgi:serine/threonine-protein kinase
MRICPQCRTVFTGGEKSCPRDGTRTVNAREHAEAEGDPLRGVVVAGRFKILDRIGIGGMGTVYRAEQQGLGRAVALKILKKEFVPDRDTVTRFHREAKAMSLLTHPNTVRVFDFGETPEGLLFLAMELLEGELLTHRIEREGPLDVATAIGFAKEILASLSEAHEKGIIHRDLKPDNIYLAKVEGRTAPVVKVLDFGIAKVIQGDRKIDQLETQAGTVFGTPRYMSPEQAQGKKLDPRSDLYAVGVLLYQMLVGHAPFIDDDAVVVMAKHIKEKPKPLYAAAPTRPIPASLERAVLKALEKDATGRYATSDEFVKRLDSVLPDVEEAGRLARTGKHPRGTLQGASRAVLVGAGVGLVLAVLVAVALVAQSGGSNDAEVTAIAVDSPAAGSGGGTASGAPNVRSTPAAPEAIAVRSEPAGAEVWRDGQLLGTTPLAVPIAAGETTVRVQLRKSGFAETVALLVPGGPSPLVTLAADRTPGVAVRGGARRGGHPRGAGGSEGVPNPGGDATHDPQPPPNNTQNTPPVRPRDPYERFD